VEREQPIPGQSEFSSIDEAVAAIARGGMVVVVDDEDRENEGDLVMAAEHVTAADVAFYVRHTAGLICVPLSRDRAAELDLAPMVRANTDAQRTAFTESVDGRAGTTTGISAADRAATARALADPSTRASDLARPGHVFPLKAREGGVLKRAGHTEAAVDLARMAGCRPVGMISEIVEDDGSMARGPRLCAFAAEHGLSIISIADLLSHRFNSERLVERVAAAQMPTTWGSFRCIAYRNELDLGEHVALVYGDIDAADSVLVRVHSECLTGDVFGSRRCDCGEQLGAALETIAATGAGVVVYLRGHEGRGIGLGHKIRAYSLQDDGLDTVDANLELGFPVDSREYGVGAQILADLGISRIRLMTNNPAKYSGLVGYGLEIVERVGHQTRPTRENVHYLETKRRRMGHLLELDIASEPQYKR
jgi:3,4-dihydroxy 2-butanone 4-phosphate synthase/GTP cyclohydrolase II